MIEQWRLVFLGGGQMAEAIAGGVIAAGLLSPDRIAASEVRADRRDYLERSVGIRAVARNAEAVAPGKHATQEHMARALSIFNATGKAVTVAEKDLDAVTGLSGSGPGYVAVMIEALIDGGVRAGLARDVATTLAIQTVLGSAQML